MARKNTGRKKIDIVKIDNDSSLQVCFSKRRAGIFKKASELCTLCGAEVAIVVFSPGFRAYSFGHPNVDEIINRYLSDHFEDAEFSEFVEACRNANIYDLNMQLNELNNQIAAAKKRGEELTRARNESRNMNWWELPIEELSFSQLMKLRSAMAELKNKVALQVQAEKLLTDKNTNALQFLMGSSSSSSQRVSPYDENIPVNMNMMNGGYAGSNVMARSRGFGGGF